MADEKRKDPFVAISTAVIVLAALGVTFFKVPLKTLRPAPELREAAEPERVRSRLWQDPFTTVLDHIQSQSKAPGSPESKKSGTSPENIWPCRLEHTDGKLDLLRHLNSDTAKKLFADNDPLLRKLAAHFEKGNKITVLAVMMPGSPYAEDIEARIRERVAVLSALGRLGYVPEDAEHLNFFRIQIKDTCREPLLLSDFIPYEWLEKLSDGQTKKVVVLWLNEDLFQPHPLVNISKLNEYFHLFDFLVPKKNLSLIIPMKVIGPSSSGTLANMIEELTGPGAVCYRFLQGLELYSPSATAPNYWLLPGLIIQRDTNPTLEKIKAEIKKFSEKNCLKFEDKEADLLKLDQQLGNAFEKAFIDQGITFRRTITSDAELADGLVNELQYRHLDLFMTEPGWLQNKAHLVLISEWDTLYGRALPETFLRVIRQHSSQVSKKVVGRIDWVHRYSYLRGLDGITHSAKDKKSHGPGMVAIRTARTRKDWPRKNR